MKKVFLLALILIGLGAGYYQFQAFSGHADHSHDSVVSEYHIHADLLIMLDGEQYDLSADRFQTTVDNPLDGVTHLHNNDGDVIHVHAEGVTLGYFLETLGFQLSEDCFITPDEDSYCNTQAKQLTFMVNGQDEASPQDYVIGDLDRILIAYGDPANATVYMEQVTDKACIYSELCPERGTPPAEECVGGLGSNCAI